jgi:hypothetical protein
LKVEVEVVEPHRRTAEVEEVEAAVTVEDHLLVEVVAAAAECPSCS